MTLPIPLTVQLSTGRTNMHIERDLRSLNFRSVAPGGFASAQFSLDRPLSQSPDEIAYYGDVYIYDARNGNCVWCGRLEDPGRGVGADGQVWDLAAVGPSAHVQDRTRQYIVIDSSLNNWERDTGTRRGSKTEIETVDDDDETTGLTSTFPDGMTVVTGDFIRWIYLPIRRAGQTLGRLAASVVNNATSSSWQNRLTTRLDGTYNTVHEVDWSTTPQGLSASFGSATRPIGAGQNRAFIIVRRSGANVNAGDDRFGNFTNVVVRSVLLNADGTTATGIYGNNYVFAHYVVRDLLGRFLTAYDGANAVIDETSTYQIDQAAWPDGVTPGKVLDDLMVLEPTKYWAAWETNSDGKHRFEWRTWPTTVRYEADVVDGFDSPGSAQGLFNAVTIRWRGAKRAIRTRNLTQTVDVLDDAGLIREEMIDLGGDIGSATNAFQAGEQFLAERQTPPNAGTLTVQRPIYDHDRGMMVQPWEIRPGHLVRVRGVMPHTDSLNASGRDGVTTFRVVAVDYDTGSAAATLELDSHPYTVAHALANLGRNVITRRD